EAAVPLTTPSTRVWSTYTSERVRCSPPRTRTTWLEAAGRRARRAGRVRGEPRGATAGTGRRPYWAQATATPTTITATVASVTVRALTGEWPWSYPVTGSSQFRKRSPMLKKAPPATDPTASTIIGIVMTFGDSWGCGGPAAAAACPETASPLVSAAGSTSGAAGDGVGALRQRSSPKNVI